MGGRLQRGAKDGGDAGQRGAVRLDGLHDHQRVRRVPCVIELHDSTPQPLEGMHTSECILTEK